MSRKWTPQDHKWRWYLVTFNQHGRSVSVKVTATSEENARRKVYYNELKEENKLEHPPCESSQHTHHDFVKDGKDVTVQTLSGVPQKRPQLQAQFDFSDS